MATLPARRPQDLPVAGRYVPHSPLIPWQNRVYSLMVMHTRLDKLVLLMVALALAVAPLRGTLAAPAEAVDEEMSSHCASMQHGDDLTQMHHTDDSAASDKSCPDGCNGDCCGIACSSCAPPVSALLDGNAPEAAIPHPPAPAATPIPFTDHTIHTLLGPPASS